VVDGVIVAQEVLMLTVMPATGFFAEALRMSRPPEVLRKPFSDAQMH
jgi:hypothetical protein